MRDYYLLADDGRNAQKAVPSGLGLLKGKRPRATPADIRSRGQRGWGSCQVPAVDCLSMETAFHLNGTVKKLVLDTDKIKAHHFFKVQGILEPYIVGSLDAAESFLRTSTR
ncbi:hypothetical protein [Brevibacillus sp. Leaf182]|uniref:hypothetical protein n=1 Tax=Brevibacillus sp. Leaf182 TaxID=1736290 RepID=UPI000B080E45|nr:hypothetical protein [Brevibacillus sp. Leaf182]RAT96295.1 hypothetical protein ASG16_018050 [Brevibacillus sp. Leaf182]